MPLAEFIAAAWTCLPDVSIGIEQCRRFRSFGAEKHIDFGSMDRNLSAAQISRRAIGAILFSGFGALWICTGLSAAHRLHAATLFATLLIGGMPALWAAWLLKRAPKPAVSAENSQQDRRRRRAFRWINGIQWVAIVIGIMALDVFKQTAYIVPMIATIVGLHLFPFARLFHNPGHYVSGTLMVSWSVGSMLLLGKEQLPSIGAFGAGIILLLSALYGLFSVSDATRERSREEAQACNLNESFDA